MIFVFGAKFGYSQYLRIWVKFRFFCQGTRTFAVFPMGAFEAALITYLGVNYFQGCTVRVQDDNLAQAPQFLLNSILWKFIL